MLILTVNSKSTIDDIVNDTPSGVNRDYLLNEDSRKRLDVLVCFANKLNEQNFVPFIEVKFASQYSAREKRIEVVGKHNDKIELYKFSATNRFDKDAIELDRIIRELRNKFADSKMEFTGTLLVDNNADNDFIQQSIKKMNLNVLTKSY